ncbi:MobF family relaxase [Amycolatopsis australiensis]|uniref:Conjugative relaxase domain-containing protein, TrwC/TraI family n=1 Tax=Amycolatopsis australiensis TaxID=546364 RepID=A0A1K1PS06_9PSEU|nr:MobF family relaxase [Amycolatopsis australiensis]SFW50345.1 conjugative relaxase domain-containing protein, TrwC/TraI family [Amycolatopsis australiensis]
MLSISTGYSVKYLTEEVAKGRENYYTGAVAAGEPPGRWYGGGAEKLGLTGLVDEQDMTAVYECFVDPRDPAFKDPARWGEASTLGHTGRKYPTEDELYAAALDAEPGATAERRAELRLEAGKRARKNVAFLDATFSVQKSVTVLHAAFEAQQVNAQRTAGRISDALAAATAAGASPAELAELARQRDDAAAAAESWRAHRDAVEDAIWAGNRAALDYLAEHAGYSRVGHHGGAAGRFIDAHDLVVASFFQHDSRNHDPQLHIHNAILNRVQGADGQWRTLDSRGLHKFRGAAAAVGERTTEEHLARALGVRFATRPDGRSREVVGIAQPVMDLFSSRRRAITRKTAKLVEQFEARFNREPTSLELDRLQRQATFATRKAKSHDGETVEARLERWDRELRAEVAGGLAGVARDVLNLAHEPRAATPFSPEEVLKTALADVQSTKAGWTAPDLTRAISDALPDQLGDLDGAQVARLLDTLTAEGLKLATPLATDRPGTAVLPEALKLANGQSAYDAPAGQLYATPEHVHTERALATATARRGAPALDGTMAEEFVAALAENGVELGADQAAAVRGVLSSGAAVESLVGPAGTGKSFVVGALAKAWQDPALWGGQARKVVGLASSQVATDVLAGEGLTARNIARWLNAQAKLAEGSTHPEHEAWRLNPGDLVVVDESAMANTADLAKIHHHVQQAGAKLLLTGDHRQLAAVGAGGGMELVADAGATYELTEVRRFAAEWERGASLRLRDGDETVLADYHKHGRIVDAGTREQAEAAAGRAWLADTLAGKHSILIVDTNEQAAQLCAELRNELVRLGRVAETGVPLGKQGTYAGAGDLIQARRNGWDLAGVEGNREVPINRKQYRVLDTREDGGLVVARVLGREDGVGEVLGERITLPGSYVAEHVALGYASTVHSAQGLTVDTSHAVVTESTGQEALYVGLTRGRRGNTAHVTTVAVPADAPDGATLEAVHRSPAAVLAGAFEGTGPQRSALAEAVEAAAETAAIRTPAELLADATELATAGRTARWLDELVEQGKLSENQRARIAAEDGGPTLARLLRRAELAGHDPRQVLDDAVTARSLSGARQLTNVIHHRITGAVSLDPVGDSYADSLPQVEDPQWAAYLRSLAETADARRNELGAQLAAEPPQWAIEAFGPVPERADERDAWVAKAGTVAAHRELTGHDDPAAALGPAPKAGQVEAYASWRSAWRALGRPESGRDELEMSDGQLLVRMRAWEREKTWGPKFVANELAGIHQALDARRRDAAMRRAEADAAADEAERDRLLQEAAEAEALAEVLAHRAAELESADEARALWYAHTAETRAAADRARAEIAARNLDTEPAPTVTAGEWLDAHNEHMAAEDAHREVTAEHDLADVVDERAGDLAAVNDDEDAAAEAGVAETAVADVRDVADAEAPVTESDEVRVASADETAESIERAQRALREIAARQVVEERHAAEEAQAAELHRRNISDAAAAAELADDDGAVSSR